MSADTCSTNKRGPCVAAIVLAAIGGVAIGVFWSSHGGYRDQGAASRPAATAATAGDVTHVFAVEGMHCNGCAGTITARVMKLPGVKAANASFEDKKATVTTEAGGPGPARIIEAIEGAGYKAHLAGQ